MPIRQVPTRPNGWDVVGRCWVILDMSPDKPVNGIGSGNACVCIGFRVLAEHKQNDTTVPTVLIGLPWPIVIDPNHGWDVLGCAGSFWLSPRKSSVYS